MIVDIITGLTNVGLAAMQMPVVKSKPDKKSRGQPSKSSNVSNLGTATVVSSSGRLQMSAKSRDVLTSSTYLSTFPKDIQSLETTPPKSSVPPMSVMSQSPITSTIGSMKDSFSLSSSSQFDPLEALILTSPNKMPSHSMGLDRGPQVTDSLSMDLLGGKDKGGLFSFGSRDNQNLAPSFGGDSSSFLSPVKSSLVKTSNSDVLSTPQKIFHDSSDGGLFTSSAGLGLSSASEMRLFGAHSHDMLTSHSTSDSRRIELSTQRSHDGQPQYFPGLMEPLHISPKSAQMPRKPDTMPSLGLGSASSPELKVMYKSIFSLSIYIKDFFVDIFD